MFAVLSILVLTPLRFSIWSTIIALVLFAIAPVLTNTYVGIREVDRDVVDALGAWAWTAFSCSAKSSCLSPCRC